MATTTFTDGVTLTAADWFNDVDAAVYQGTMPAGATALTVTGATTLAVYNTIATTINAFGAATTVSIGKGAASTLNANFTTAINLNTGAVVSNQTTLAVFNTTSTTVNAFGAATTLNIGNAGGTNTVLGATTFSQKVTLTSSLLQAAGTTVTGSTYDWSAAPGEVCKRFSYAGTCTVTLPSPSTYAGKMIFLKNYASQPVNSASANCTDSTGSATASMLPATAGAWAIFQADGTYWRTMASGT